MADDTLGSGEATVQVTVVVCAAPREVREWSLELAAGACVGDALRESGADVVCQQWGMDTALIGVWGRTTTVDTKLVHMDRVEVYRALKVDPKVARRERFARQGARTTGLFARQRPGGKSGY
jgi:putative ubiquitin-RnfH superfamily antitoxin RatB of RatAB toxin-antitoxin module